MKIDDLFNKTNVDVSTNIQNPIVCNDMLNGWTVEQMSKGFKRSVSLAVSYFGDSENKLDNPRMPFIDDMVAQIVYAMDVYSTRHSDIHILHREWRSGYPDVQIDFCVEFLIRRPSNFLNFMTVVNKILDDYMENNLEFIGQSQFRDLNNVEMPDRNEYFYTAAIFLTTLRFGCSPFCRTPNILRSRFKNTNLNACDTLLYEMLQHEKDNIETFSKIIKTESFVDDVIDLSRRLYKSDMFNVRDDIGLRLLTHSVADFTWKYISMRLLHTTDTQAKEIRKYIEKVHKRLDEIKYITEVTLDPYNIDFHY